MKNENNYTVQNNSTPLTGTGSSLIMSSPPSFSLTLSDAPLRYTNILFYFKDGQITINLKDGTVTIPEGMPMNVAASGFWEAVRKAF